jgi:hypothetical protein
MKLIYLYWPSIIRMIKKYDVKAADTRATEVIRRYS